MPTNIFKPRKQIDRLVVNALVAFAAESGKGAWYVPRTVCMQRITPV